MRYVRKIIKAAVSKKNLIRCKRLQGIQYNSMLINVGAFRFAVKNWNFEAPEWDKASVNDHARFPGFNRITMYVSEGAHTRRHRRKPPSPFLPLANGILATEHIQVGSFEQSSESE